MPTAPNIEAIARQAHACWCEEMIKRDWRYGPYDEAAKTHDALVPFDELHKRDRFAALRAAKYDAVEWLGSFISYTRGPARDFTIEEMRQGLPVVSTAELPADRPPERGVITDWVRDKDDELELIIVTWQDGTVSECLPWMGEIARADET